MDDRPQRVDDDSARRFRLRGCAAAVDVCDLLRDALRNSDWKNLRAGLEKTHHHRQHPSSGFVRIRLATGPDGISTHRAAAEWRPRGARGRAGKNDGYVD